MRLHLLSALTASIFFLFTPSVFGQLDFLGFYPSDEENNDIWGYEDSLGNQYVLLGQNSQTLILDVTDPNNIIPLHSVPGDGSIWRDIKTWDGFAYVTNEEGGGLDIIDLRYLPDSIHFERFTADTLDLQTAHNIFIDEQGYAYIFGSNLYVGGVDVFDVNTTNRYQPTYLGSYTEQYVHDGYVRGDTMYLSEILNGTQAIVDNSNPESPTTLARFPTSSNFTHQCWLDSSGQYLVTVDEVEGANIDVYDVSDLLDIKETDRYQRSEGSGVIPHNAFWIGDYIVASHYTDGVVLINATRKSNLVEVGNFDTSPFPSAPEFYGCWGVYPFFSNGMIAASDIEEGLYLMQPQFPSAAYLEGNITEENTGFPLANVQIEILGTDAIKRSRPSGDYSNGLDQAGTYAIRFSGKGCTSKIVPNVELALDSVTLLDVVLTCPKPPTNLSILASDNPIQITPNPVQSAAWLEFPSASGTTTLDLYTLDGKLLMHLDNISSNSIAMDLSHLDHGQYYLQLTVDGQSHTIPLIKE